MFLKYFVIIYSFIRFKLRSQKKIFYFEIVCVLNSIIIYSNSLQIYIIAIYKSSPVFHTNYLWFFVVFPHHRTYIWFNVFLNIISIDHRLYIIQYTIVLLLFDKYMGSSWYVQNIINSENIVPCSTRCFTSPLCFF